MRSAVSNAIMATSFDTFAGWKEQPPSLSEFLRVVARTYEQLPVFDPDALPAYTSLCGELWQQFRAIPDSLTLRYTDVDPYPTSHQMFKSVDAGLLLVFTGGDLPPFHPFTQLAPNGQTFNIIFRVVHDYLAHYLPRNSFGPQGEYRAFKVHAATLLPLSVRALATETLGQNACYNFGTFPGTYPTQKTALFPSAVIDSALTLEFK